jgi:hypothetical protein
MCKECGGTGWLAYDNVKQDYVKCSCEASKEEKKIIEELEIYFCSGE